MEDGVSILAAAAVVVAVLYISLASCSK